MEATEPGGARDPLARRRLLIDRARLESRRLQRSTLRRGTGLVRDLLIEGLDLAGLLARGQKNALSLRVREARLEFPGLPAEFSGFRILHLSDLHLDGVPGLTEALCETIGGLEADVCLMTGDYRYRLDPDRDTDRGDLYRKMEKVLDAVRIRRGVLGILGNHDAAEDVLAFERMGMRVLINEAVELRGGQEGIWIGGIDFLYLTGHPSGIPEAFRELPPGAFRILMAHSPDHLEEAVRCQVDLYLCGHTHGGQVCLPGIGPLVNKARCSRKYLRGNWRYKSLQGCTSAGVGTSGLPVRFFCPPEVGLIELRRPS